jgi:uncharacterized protein
VGRRSTGRRNKFGLPRRDDIFEGPARFVRGLSRLRRAHYVIGKSEDAVAESEIDFHLLWLYVAEQFPLGEGSVHGPQHWRRVEQNGLKLATGSGADVTVVRLFAVFHDSRRVNEFTDHEHGLRGGELAQLLRGELFELDDARFALLYYACAFHERGRTSKDPTIGTCWDADRLDLPRVSIQPSARLMSTALGKRLASAP